MRAASTLGGFHSIASSFSPEIINMTVETNPDIRVQDLEPDDVATVACSACGDSQTFSYRGLWQGIRLLHSSPSAKVVDLVWPKCCPKCNAEGTAVVTIKQAKPGDGGGRPGPDGLQ
jgi:hypothetical protein